MKTTTDLTQTKASLFDIEVGWLDLIIAREAAEEESADRPVCLTCGGRGKWPVLADNGETDAASCLQCEGTGRSKSPREIAIESADVAIAEHVSRELAKVDGIIGFCRFLEFTRDAAKLERDRQRNRMQTAENLLAQIKAGAQYAMGALGRKRIDGSRGYLLVKGNGGVAPLVIQDEKLLPDDLCRMEGWVRADLWELAVDLVRSQPGPSRGTRINDFDLKRVPDNGAIRARLAEDCPQCKGAPELEPDGCAACGGSGKAAVPGAYIAERGSHVEVR